MRIDSSNSIARSALTLGLAALALVGCGDGDTSDTSSVTTDTETDGGVGNVTIDPCQYDFGAVAVRSTNTATLGIQNSGSADLGIIGISTTSPFSVNATTPITVAAGSQYQFTLVFSPTTFGEFSAEVVVQSDDADTPEVRCPIQGEVVEDGDGDGYASAEAGGTDCDDADPEVNPGAEEVWYDGEDQDCDGANDYDQDGDGFISSAYNDDPATGGGDCQDVDASISPAASDVWYDGVDSDCDGANDYDQDGDGYSAADYSGTDCDDELPEVNPGGTEVWNGLDDDCNDLVDDAVDELGAELAISADSSAEGVGWGLAGGDWDDSGDSDLVVGAPFYNPSGSDGQGRIGIFMNGSATDGDAISAADYLIEGQEGTDRFGYATVDLGDFTGDGIGDLAVSAPAAVDDGGSVYLLSGADLASVDLGTPAMRLDGLEDMQLGTGLSAADLDGDGNLDLIAWGHDADLPYNHLAVQYSGNLGSFGYQDVDASWMELCGADPASPSAKGCGPGNNPPPGGNPDWSRNGHPPMDLDGDGYDDLVMGDGYSDVISRDEGRVWVLWGRSVPYTSYLGALEATATVIAEGAVQDDLLGRVVGPVPDVDGDGDAELWVTQDGRTDVNFVSGSSDLRVGNLSLPDDADAVFESGNDTDAIGGIKAVGDWTGDGIGDAAFQYFLETDRDNGILFLMETAPWWGSYDFDDEAAFQIIGGDEGEKFSQALPVIAPDLDNDGRPDLFVGDPTGSASEDGRAHIYYNHHGL